MEEERGFLCSLCHHKQVVVRCLDCKRFLCPECRISHTEIPACIYHVMEDVETFKERHKQRLHDIVEGYIALVCECEQNSRDLSRYAENIQGMKRQVLERIQDSAFTLQDHVTRVHQHLVDVVDNVTREEERRIQHKLLQLQKTCSQVVGKTNIITTVIENDDTKTITDELFVGELQSDYSNDCPLYESKLASLRVPEKLLQMQFVPLQGFEETLNEIKILVHGSGDNNPDGKDDFSELSFKCFPTKKENSDRSGACSLDTGEMKHLSLSMLSMEDPYPKKMSELIDNPLEIKTMHKYDTIVRRLAIIDDEIWAIMNEGGVIVSCSDSCEIKREFKIKERDPDPPWWLRLVKDNLDITYDCMMVVQCRKEVIICLGKSPNATNDITELETQIMQIDLNGVVVNKMVSSSYCDIACDEQVLYALLSGTPNKVDIFKSDGGEGSSYLHMRTISLETGRTYYRLIATAGVVYVTGLRHEVHRYHIETEHRYTHGTYGVRLAGELDTPKLCCVDDYGVILVADCHNHRLQVLDRCKQWHLLHLPSTTCPWDGVWCSSTGALCFVASEKAEKSELLKVIVQPKKIVISTPKNYSADESV